MDNEKKLAELIWEIPEVLRSWGLGFSTIGEYIRGYARIQHYHALRGTEYFDRSIMTDYVRGLEEGCENGKFSKERYGLNLRAARQLTEYHDTGKLEWSVRGRVSRFILNEYYESLLSGLIANSHFHKNTRGDVTWVARKYFAWLLSEGHTDLTATGTAELRRFMIHCSQHMAVNSLRDVQLHLRKLYGYLTSSGVVDVEYAKLLSVPLNKQAKLYPATSRDEINKTLDVIDRRTVKGKRDYAIILLGVVTGLRAIDIARLKLTDIDYINGEIKLAQSKTGGSLALPLTADVGEAVSDYILNGRQHVNCEYIFLRMKAPVKEFGDGVPIEDIYDDYRKKAGLPRDAGDGKGFHSLRRTLGRDLVTSGAPVTTAAQILGHANISAMKKYIPLDSIHLKECALPFDGIALNGGDCE